MTRTFRAETERTTSPLTDRHAELPDDHQLAERISEARQLLDDLELGWRHPLNEDDPADKPRKRGIRLGELIRRSRHGTRDVFPPSVRREGGGPSTVLDTWCDTHDRDVARCDGCTGKPIPSIADPVGELAVATNRIDPVRHAATRALLGLQGATGDLRMAVSALASAEPPPAVVPDGVWCVVHERHKMHEPRMTTSHGATSIDKCRWCWDYYRTQGVEPTRELLQLRASGKRIHQRDIDKAVRAVRQNQRSRAS